MPEIKVPITYASLLQLGGILVALAIAWSAMNSQVSAMSGQLNAMSAQLVDTDLRLRSLELGYARIEEKLTPIGRMDDRLRNMEKEMRK